MPLNFGQIITILNNVFHLVFSGSGGFSSSAALSMSQTCLQQQRDAAAAAAASATYGPYSAMFHHATHHSTADLYSRSCAAATGSTAGSAASHSMGSGGYGSPPVTSAGSLGHPQGSSGTFYPAVLSWKLRRPSCNFGKNNH